jgi:hypothetical protein
MATVPGTASMPGMATVPGTTSMPGMATVPGTAGMPGMTAMPGAPGMPGMPGAPGMPQPPGTSSSTTASGSGSKQATVLAAQKFLDAVKDKDLQKLQEAIALRAPFESQAKHRTLFANIRDGQIDQATLDELHEAFDEMKAVGMNTPKSTGLRGIIFSKQSKDKGKNETVSRTVYVRREVAGWKVLDFSGPHVVSGYASRSKRRR